MVSLKNLLSPSYARGLVVSPHMPLPQPVICAASLPMSPVASVDHGQLSALNAENADLRRQLAASASAFAAAGQSVRHAAPVPDPAVVAELEQVGFQFQM